MDRHPVETAERWTRKRKGTLDFGLAKKKRQKRKKRKADSPKHGEKDPEKQNIENKERKIMAGIDSLMKMLENR